MIKLLRDAARTSGVADPEGTDIDRRAQDVIRFGVIKEVDYKKKPPSYRVAIGDEKDEDNYILTDWLPAAGARAKGDRETHFLEKGEKVILLVEGGELSTAHVLPAGVYNPKNEDEKEVADKAGIWRKKFKNGAEISYDRNEKKWLIDGTDEGEMTIKAGKCTITLKGGTVTVNGETKALVQGGGSEGEFKGGHVNIKGEDVHTVGKTHLGVKSKDEEGKKKAVIEGLQIVPRVKVTDEDAQPDPKVIAMDAAIAAAAAAAAAAGGGAGGGGGGGGGD